MEIQYQEVIALECGVTIMCQYTGVAIITSLVQDSDDDAGCVSGGTG